MDSERSNLKSSSPRIKSLPSGDFFQTEGSNFQTEEELTKKAREELKEDQETRDHAIERLRELIQNEDNLHTNMSDAFLLRFLRSRKYDLERALTLVKNYCSAKANYPAIYKNLVLSNVAEVFESEMFTFLPGVDYQGRAVSLSSFHNWDTSKISSDQFLHAIILSCESILEDECFQISGVVGIVDLGEFTFRHLQQITPAFTYKAFSFMQDWCPIRFQGVFFVRGNVFFDLAFRIASPFIRSKLRQRIHFWGRNVDVLKEYFPVGTLPISLGGTHDSSNDGKNFLRHIMSQETESVHRGSNIELLQTEYRNQAVQLKNMTSQSDPWIPRFPSIQHLPSGYFFPTEGNHFLTKEELTRKAKKELKEDLETRDNAIQRLRKLIQKEDNLYADTSDAFLVRFLRSRKYDIERAIELVKTYYSAKADYPAIYKNLVPSEVAEVFESGFLTVLPGVDYQGRVVFVASVSNWDPSKISGDQYLRALILACETLLEDECFQISGLMAIVDLSGFTAEQLCQFTPAFCYRLFRFLQDWCPMRFQGVFYVRENAFFDVAFKIASPFIGPKLRERIRFLGEDVDVLKEHFPADILPTSLGGTHDSSNDGRNYLRHLRTKEARFRSNNETYGYKM